ncbi:carboxypeptidase-like regulatory domain-containing protein [Flavobacteriaceae bacterium]|nr:carboxypeptidase-like regulatory domain-containing protein [Flavobacteriaceae bacterium]
MKSTATYQCLLLIFILPSVALCQSATLRGVVLNESNEPIAGVNVITNNRGTTTNINGFYLLKIPANETAKIRFSHLNYKYLEAPFNLKNGEELEFNPVLKTNYEQIETIVIRGSKRKELEGVTTISPQLIRTIKGAQPGVENLLKTLPGVNISNELSTQYSVRGGNFDENLVYVNEIEVYRPFLVRSGQQEGLSFVNSDMVQNLDFSAGGFQAKYGDKLSSVLDITYRTPIEFGVQADLSLLGGSVTAESVSKDSKFSALVGLRYRDNSLLVDSKETETNFTPKFADAQTYLTYKFSDKFHLSFLGNLAINDYNYQPQSRQTNFGTLQDPLALIVFYEGQENDKYQTYFGAFKGSYFVNENLTLKLITSTFHTTEQEYFDILAQYRLGEVNSNIGDEDLGEVEFSEGIGSQINHARNDLDALITNVEHKGHLTSGDHNFEWSIKYTHEDIRDRIVEWEVIDSAGFSINPPKFSRVNDQPYNHYEGPLVPYKNIRSTNNTQINRVQAYGQWNVRSMLGEHEVYANIGVRYHEWTVQGVGIKKTKQSVGRPILQLAPRVQLAIKPDWNKDMLFRLSGGLYYQPPFYRELRNSDGLVNTNVKAQKSVHFVLANDYSFKIWDRPFKLVSEAYYKNISDVNPYTVENVRIRYAADNNAKAYAYGLDLRLNGEFVPGTESWFSFGYLNTQENISNQGYIARPTDQRLKFGILFQDYVPKIPNLKMYLNLVYNTGVPGGSPSYASPYNYQNRLPDYKRADVGMSYVIIDTKSTSKNGWKKRFKEFSVGVEIFNMFDVQNSITNTWVRDVYSKRQYAIPNYLTPRVFNVRLGMRF